MNEKRRVMKTAIGVHDETKHNRSSSSKRRTSAGLKSV